jgi:hypothetical protein
VAEIDTSKEYWHMTSKIIYVNMCTDTYNNLLHLRDPETLSQSYTQNIKLYP